MFRPCASRSARTGGLLTGGVLLLLWGDASAQPQAPLPPTETAPATAPPGGTVPQAPAVAPAPAPPDSAPTPTAAPLSPAELSAKELTSRGIRDFQTGQFDAAVEAFSAAYVLSPNPMFLFNIGQAHRKAGHPREALTNYQLFLRKAPDSPLRPETEAYIALVQAQLQTPAANSRLAPEPSTARDVHSSPPMPGDHGGRTATSPAHEAVYKKGWFYAVLGGSALLIGTSIGLGVFLATQPPPTTLGIIEPTF